MTKRIEHAPPNESQIEFKRWLTNRNRSERTISEYCYWHIRLIEDGLENDLNRFLERHRKPIVRAFLIALSKSRGLPIDLEKVSYKRKELPSYMEEHKETALIDSMHIPRHYVITWLLSETGLRIHEALHIKLLDIKLYEEPPRIMVTGKGGSQAFIYPSKELIEAMLSLRRPDNSQWVFASPINIDRPLTANAVRYQLKKRNKDLHPHMFRHTYAKKNLDRGVNLSTIQRLLRHRDISTTGVYLKIADTEVQEASKKTWRKESRYVPPE